MIVISTADSNRWIEVSASCDIENQVNYEEGFIIAYVRSSLPREAQFFQLYCVLYSDVCKDSHL